MIHDRYAEVIFEGVYAGLSSSRGQALETYTPTEGAPGRKGPSSPAEN
jgi:hypothetical protein